MPDYSAETLRLVAGLQADGRALEVGSGGRRVDDRVVGLDREGAGAEVVGDALALPFADETFDLVFSEAVLEHVRDPRLMCTEMVRVLRPGGWLYLEAAFMQPVHMAPDHYFNITPYGLRALVEDLVVVEQEWVWGGFGDTMAWWAPEAEAAGRSLDAALGDVLQRWQSAATVAIRGHKVA